MKRFASTHEWVEIENGVATIGISQFAADEMKELSYVELPEVGRLYKAGDCFGSVESLKAASEIFAPVTGTVCEVNTGLEVDPEGVNRDAEGTGWICKFNALNEAETNGLMTKEAYLQSVN